MSANAWYSVLDKQCAMVEWAESQTAAAYTRGFLEDVRRKHGDRAAVATMSSLQAMSTQLRRATPMHVHPDVMTLIEAAVPSFRPEPILAEDFPTPWGLVVLPRPFFIEDVHGKRAAFSRFNWSPAVIGDADRLDDPEQRRPGVALTLWATAADWALDDYADGLAELRAQAAKRGLPPIPDHDLSFTHTGGWPFGQDAPQWEHEHTGWWTSIQVLLRIAAQKITAKQSVLPARPFRRRAARLDIEPTVVVVKLRREKRDLPEGHEPEPAHYSHRFIVDGHWRNQWYPSIRAHRQIWIADFIKGDESLPLKVRAGRVFDFSR